MRSILFIIVSTLLLSGCWELSRGQKIGNIVKVAEEGAIWNTYEATIIRGGMNDGSGSFGAPFDFTVPNIEDAIMLKKAMYEQKEIVIYYHEELFFTPCRSDSRGIFLDKFEVLQEKSKKK